MRSLAPKQFAFLGWLALMAAACGSPGPGAPDSAATTADSSLPPSSDGPVAERAGAAGTEAGLDGGPGQLDARDPSDAGQAAPACGFVMPNPPSANLPHPAAYDTSVPGVVSDQVTGLMWQRQVTGHPQASTGCTVNLTGLQLCPWRYATAYCEESRVGGHDDWRLPTIIELISLMDYTRQQPQIDQAAFPDTPAEIFWSATRLAGRRDFAHYVSFRNSDVSAAFIDEPHRVRCVRSGGTVPLRCAPADGRFQIMGDLVADGLTDLTWRRAAAPQTMAWSPAGSYCVGLGAGFRLPSIKELFTILDFTRWSSREDVLDRAIWQGSQGSYWSSSVNVQEYMSAWVLNFQDGRPGIAGFSNGIIDVRCVR